MNKIYDYSKLTLSQLIEKIDYSYYFQLPKLVAEAFRKLSATPPAPSYELPYKILRGLITQVGINAPTIEILENTLDLGSITPVYASNGQYDLIVQNPIFVREKLYLSISPTDSTNAVSLFYAGAATVRFNVKNTPINTLVDGALNKNPFEIIVYN